MTKAGLLKAIEEAPDNAEVLIGYNEDLVYPVTLIEVNTLVSSDGETEERRIEIIVN